MLQRRAASRGRFIERAWFVATHRVQRAFTVVLWSHEFATGGRASAAGPRNAYQPAWGACRRAPRARSRALRPADGATDTPGTSTARTWRAAGVAGGRAPPTDAPAAGRRAP